MSTAGTTRSPRRTPARPADDRALRWWRSSVSDAARYQGAIAPNGGTAAACSRLMPARAHTDPSRCVVDDVCTCRSCFGGDHCAGRRSLPARWRQLGRRWCWLSHRRSIVFRRLARADFPLARVADLDVPVGVWCSGCERHDDVAPASWSSDTARPGGDGRALPDLPLRERWARGVEARHQLRPALTERRWQSRCSIRRPAGPSRNRHCGRLGKTGGQDEWTSAIHRGR
jgi:hypothetical protein